MLTKNQHTSAMESEGRFSTFEEDHDPFNYIINLADEYRTTGMVRGWGGTVKFKFEDTMGTLQYCFG